jgi:hypothetical protein
VVEALCYKPESRGFDSSVEICNSCRMLLVNCRNGAFVGLFYMQEKIHGIRFKKEISSCI